ncbi:MAG TPA: hypothetical protein VH599_06725 [Ktedonobacterales bacterium]|jgi:capsular polysaccharide biosynthesis protein
MRSDNAYWFGMFSGIRKVLWVYRLAVQRAYLIILGILLVASAAYIWSSQQIITYQASAFVMVADQSHASPDAPLEGVAYAATLAAQYAARPITSAMIGRAQASVPRRGAAQIREEVHLAAVTGQPLIMVTAVDTDAPTAMALANSMAGVLAQADTDLVRQADDQKVATLQSQVNTLSVDVGKTINAIALARHRGSSGASLQAKLQQQQMELDQLQIQLAQAQRNAASVQPMFWVSSLALSASQNAPNLLLNTSLGALAGALGGLGLAEMADLLGGVVRGVEDFLRWEQVSPLGEVPDAPANESPFVFTDEMYTAVAQPFRRVWKNLQFLSGQQTGQATLVLPVGSVPFDGWVGLNLAVTSARLGQRTLLLDTNWIQPTVEGYFQLPVSEQGFFTSLAAMNPSSLDHWLAIKPTDTPHLFVLPAGPLSSYPDVLAQPQLLVELFGMLRQDFAQIIVLPPPKSLQLSDGVFMEQMNHVLLVARSKHTTIAEIKPVLAELEKADSPFLGAVVLVSTSGLFSHLPLGAAQRTEETEEP